MTNEQGDQIRVLYVALNSILHTLLPNSLEKNQAIARLAESSYWAERCVRSEQENSKDEGNGRN